MSGYARHEWIDRFCQMLHRMIVGERAERMLADGAPDGTVVVLPSWAWFVPAIDIGRKAHRHDGQTMLMPVRIVWEGGPVHVIEPGTVTSVRWSMTGMGHSAVGSMEIDERLVRTRQPQDDDGTGGGEPLLSEVTVARGRSAEDALSRLVESGVRGRWDAMMELEKYVELAVLSAVRRVSLDILAGVSHSAVAPEILDATAREQVRDAMMLGTPERDGAVPLLLNRCLDPMRFVRVEPLRFIKVDLRRAAELYVRQAVGDPPIGTKVRRVFRDLVRRLPEATLEELISTYRERYPNDALSVKRAVAALTAGRDAMAGAHSFDRLVGGSIPHDHRDDAGVSSPEEGE